MTDIERLSLLTSQMHLEAAEDVGNKSAPINHKEIRIHRAALASGRHIPLLKTLLSSYCENDCYYCPFRAGRDFQRASFTPQEFSDLFMNFHKAGVVRGLFLSSGLVHGGTSTQDKLLDTAFLLRNHYHYRGYIHLKIMPGAERDQIFEAMRLADRVSINLEAPNASALSRVAPGKRFEDELLSTLLHMNQIRRQNEPHQAWNDRWASSTTQFVVGGSSESDLDLLAMTENLHHQAGISRAYYSRFNPVPDTPLESHPPTLPERELRLYQASFLLRDYGYQVEELPFQEDGMLPLEKDPKTSWADDHLRGQPLEINTASKSQLLRVPGMGPQGVDKVLRARQHKSLAYLSQLRSLGIRIDIARPYILLKGKPPPQQLSLF